MNDPTETRADLEEDLEAAIQAVTGVEGGDLRRGMRLLLVLVCVVRQGRDGQ